MNLENGHFILNVSRYVQFISDLCHRAKTYMNFQKLQITYMLSVADGSGWVLGHVPPTLSLFLLK